MKTVSREKLQYYRDVAKDRAIALTKEVQDLMDEYDHKQKDKIKADEAWGVSERFILEQAYDWIDELEEVYKEVRLDEIIMLDKIRKTMELFSDNDERCVYKFIKQIDPFKNLMKNEAYTVLTKELLTKDVQCAMPNYVKTTQQVYRFLLDKFGGIQKKLEKWVSQLE